MDWPKRPQDLERIVDQLPLGLSYLDRQLRVVHANDLLLSWMGMTREHAVGRHCYELVAEMRGLDPAEASPCSYCRVPAAVATNQTQRFVNEVRPDFVVENTTVPIIGDDGEVVGTMEVLEDITARRRAERVLEESRDELERRVAERTAQLEELNRLQELFLDILRHDLTNPLQVARICHRHLRDECEPRRGAQRYLDGLEDAVERAMKVVTDAATYGRVETIDSLHREEVDLLGVLQTATSRLEPVQRGRGPRIRVTALGCYPVYGDASLLELVFTNLLSNALAYSPEEEPVEVDVVDEVDGWCVCVADRGTGIPEEHRTTIFERFIRGSRGGVRGTGLGLAIAQRVVELHDGDIWVEENPGGGSVFCVRLAKHDS